MGEAPHVVFHTDACQAAAYLPLNIAKLHVDLLTLNGSKIYGPKGVGLLYAKRGDQITAIDVWWELEKALRPGTENVAGIVGLKTALEIVERRREQDIEHLRPLQAMLMDGI